MGYNFKIKTMKNLKNLKNYKTLERLEVKARDEWRSRMPSLKMVARLLDELGIDNSCHETSTQKWSKPSGYRYYTSGGTRDYHGYDLWIPEINMRLDSTETYYSWNANSNAREILDLIEEKTSKK